MAPEVVGQLGSVGKCPPALGWEDEGGWAGSVAWAPCYTGCSAHHDHGQQ